MVTEKLIVKNFGPIHEAELDLRKVTVLIGPQASGKSALAKLISIFSDVLFNEFTFSNKIKEFNIQPFLSEETYITFVHHEFLTSYRKGNANKKITSSRLDYTVKEHDKLKDEWLYGGSKKSTKLGARATGSTNIFKKSSRDRLLLRDAWLSISLKLRDISPQAQYFPAERTMVAILSTTLYRIEEGGATIPEFLIDFANAFEIAKGHVSNLNIPFLNVTHKISNGTSKVILNNNSEINLSDSATGFQSSIPMALIIEQLQEASANNLFIIEEPELNLYPTTQKKLVEYLIEKCTHGDNRLIITTHSPYILTALNNCIQAHNVAKLHPENAEEVNKLVPPQYQIAYEDVAAYYVGGGTVKSIMNEEFQMIDANALDDVSEELSVVFDKLLDLKYQNQE